MPETTDTLFSDIPLSFLAHPISGNVVSLTNRESVKQSVKNIVLTNFYERPYKPYFGTNLIAQLFENFEPTTQFIVENNIRIALQNYEPRADVYDVVVRQADDYNHLSVTINFRVKSELEPIQVDVLIERVR